MKTLRKILTVSALVIVSYMMPSCCTDSYVISGIAPDEAEEIVLSIQQGREKVNLDTVKVSENGDFTFTGTIDYPMYAMLSYKLDEQSKTFARFFLSNDSLSIIKEDESSHLMKAVGGINDEFENAMKLYKNLQDDNQIFVVTDSLISANPNSHVMSYLLLTVGYYSFSVDQSDELISKFSDEVKNDSYIASLLERLDKMRPTKVGQKFVDFSCFTIDSTEIKLSDYVKEGQWVLVDFWASWCGPCRHENPNVVKAYRLFHDKGLEIIGVSLDNQKNKWQEAVAKDSLTWIHVSDLQGWKSEPASLYGVSSIPNNALISPEGIIVARGLREEALIDFLSENLK